MKERMRLTAKQEAFAQAIADGKTGADAYRISYDAAAMTDNAIYREASLLAVHPKVSRRISELREALEERVLWTRAQSVRSLIKALEIAERIESPTAMTGATRELNMMHGYNEPIALDVTTRELPASIDEFV